MHDIYSLLATILHQRYQSDMPDLQVLKYAKQYCLLHNYYQLITNILAGAAGSFIHISLSFKLQSLLHIHQQILPLVMHTFTHHIATITSTITHTPTCTMLGAQC